MTNKEMDREIKRLQRYYYKLINKARLVELKLTQLFDKRFNRIKK